VITAACALCCRWMPHDVGLAVAASVVASLHCAMVRHADFHVVHSSLSLKSFCCCYDALMVMFIS